MTQKIFDTDNAEDMALLWSILSDNTISIEKKDNNDGIFLRYENGYIDEVDIFKINWHDKTEIIRPIPEVTREDIGKICAFWNDEAVYYGKLGSIRKDKIDKGKIYYELKTHLFEEALYLHCRRLTKKEIEELF